MTHPTDHLRRYAEDIASAVSPARSRVAALRAIGASRPERPHLLPRVAFASLAGLLVLNVAAAGVADAAVPGDALYAIDRAYEALTDAVGLGEDHTTERVAEAWTLMERDDLTGAIDLMATEVTDDSVRQVAGEMKAVGPEHGVSAQHVQSLLEGVQMLAHARGDHDSEAWREARAALDLVGDQVSAAAREQGGSEAPPAAEPGPPDNAGQQGPPDNADPQGPPPDAGPPDNAGQQSPPDNAGEQGPPPDAGPPDDTDDKGPPDEPGQQGSGGGNQSNPGQSGGRP